ncbi:MAG: M56 family metallopeptidase [Siphonobacter sp.]
MNWLHYLIQVNLYLTGFYGFYRFVLRSETFHQLNRSFLLLGTALSFFIPAMQSDWVKSWLFTQQINATLYHYYNPAFVFGQPDSWQNEVNAHPIRWGHLLAILYLFGILFFLGKFSFQLHQLNSLFRNRWHRKAGDKDAFAFFNHFFVGKGLQNRTTIEAHERVHVRQLHSADVIFFELVTIFNWFNPIVHLLKQDIRLLHEYLADEVASQQEASRAEYAMLLFSQQFGVNLSELSHPFFQSSMLKSRINMLRKQPSRRSVLAKYVLIVPVFCGMIFTSAACSDSEHESIRKTSEPTSQNKKEVSSLLEAHFPGNDKAMYKYLANNLHYPNQAQRANISGKVFLSFIVEKDGAISDVNITKGFGCDAEAVRVVKNMPKWTPSKQNGVIFRIRFHLPISFILE